MRPSGSAGSSADFASLSEAVLASRPGHTILLLPGRHEVSGAPVRIAHALRILGRGGAEVAGEPGLESLLHVQATAQLRELRLHSRRGSCVLHSAGTLRVLRCILHAEALGLPHLVAQLATDACGPRDRLVVAETRLLGDCGAPVRTLGAGELSGARAIYLPHHTLAWFEVDAGRPGTKRRRPEGAVEGKHAEDSPAKKHADQKQMLRPVWAGAFDPEQLQLALGVLGSATGAVPAAESGAAALETLAVR